MDWAKRVAEMSYARRRHVGAVIVKDDTVISYGYNGMPAGWDNNCEDKEYIWQNKQADLSMDELEAIYSFKDEDHPVGRNGRFKLTTKLECLHAESNAISKLAKSNNSGDGAYMFVTTAPCLECAKLIYQSGIKHVFYEETYRSDSGLTFLEKCKVKLTKLEK
jgi:dCMP deaminase